MAKKANLENIMKELKAIKKLVLRDLQLDIEDINLDKKGIKTKSSRKFKKIFDSVEEWKAHIWDECTHKKTVSKKREIDYKCNLLKKPCKFGYCPLNIKKS